MEQTIDQRLADYIYSKKHSVNSFSKLIGMSQGTLNQQANGTARVSTETLTAIALTFPQANMRWFLTGNGDMEYAAITQNNTRGHNFAGTSVDSFAVTTLLDIIKNLQDENASLIRMISNKA
jgi:hypothetical protein